MGSLPGPGICLMMSFKTNFVGCLNLFTPTVLWYNAGHRKFQSVLVLWFITRIEVSSEKIASPVASISQPQRNSNKTYGRKEIIKKKWSDEASNWGRWINILRGEHHEIWLLENFTKKLIKKYLQWDTFAKK